MAHRNKKNPEWQKKSAEILAEINKAGAGGYSYYSTFAQAQVSKLKTAFDASLDDAATELYRKKKALRRQRWFLVVAMVASLLAALSFLKDAGII